MARRPDVPCADCGKPMWSGTTSLPPGQARCQPCRASRRERTGPRCSICGARMSKGSKGTAPCHACSHRGPLARACEVCGKPFAAKPSSPQRTCSLRCGCSLRERERTRPTRLPKERPPPPAASHIWIQPCKVCDQLFVARRPRATFCSRDCRLADGRARARASFVSQAKPTTRPCADCGQDYTTPTARNAGVCKRCQKRRRGSDHRSRARARGVRYEPINRLAVFERDRWRCGLCGGRIARKQSVPHPKSATLDHIVPLAAGGDHVMANVQAAHFLCNVRKNAGGSQQLCLIG